MKVLKNILIFIVIAASSNGAKIGDSIKVLEKLLISIGTALTVDFYGCWDEDNTINLVKTLNTRNLMVSIQQHDNLITNFPESHQHNIFIVLDLTCENVKRLLKQMEPSEVFRETKTIILDTMGRNEILDVLKDYPLLPGSEVFYFVGNDDGIDVEQAYKTSLENPLLVEIYGRWMKNNDSFTDLRRIKITSRRRKNLNHAMLKASMVITNNDTINHLDDYHDKHIDTITKVNYQLTNRLAEWLNASVSYSEVSSWGYKDNTTNEWSGMIGALATKSVDLGASPLFFTADRIDVIDYIACTSQTRSKFVFRSPKLSYTDNVFVLPFDGGVWMSLGSMVFTFSVALYVASRVEWKSSITGHVKDASILKPSYYESFFVLYCAFCQQGSFPLPISLGSRLIAVIAFTALMFLYASYSANIVALLQSPSNKIKTLEDLYNAKIDLGVDDTVFNHYYFAHADEKICKAIYLEKIKRKDGSENFFNITDGVRMLRDGQFAFHMEVGVGYKILLETFKEDEKCDLQEIQYLQVIDPFYAIQKNSSYRELFKVGLFLLHEFGLQDRENSKLYTKRPKCSGQSSKFISVGLVDVEQAILIYLYGVGIAVLVFLLEIFHKRLRGKFFDDCGLGKKLKNRRRKTKLVK